MLKVSIALLLATGLIAGLPGTVLAAPDDGLESPRPTVCQARPVNGRCRRFRPTSR